MNPYSQDMEPETEASALDDRNEVEPEFLIDEELAYSIGYSDEDPAI